MVIVGSRGNNASGVPRGGMRAVCLVIRKR